MSKQTPDTNGNFNPEKWFDENIKVYESLAANVANTLQTTLDKQNVMYVSIPYRAKSKASFLKKWANKKYKDINDMTDLAGVRVITLVESDLNGVEKAIRKLFNVHEEDSGDKADQLGDDKFGYRSRHFVCDIGPVRETLFELKHFKGKCFEIQIRTALAHAWAEIEHDRGYKLEGGLPSNLKRRLNLVAALLESADNEFNRLTEEIEKYKNAQDEIHKNNLKIPLNYTNIAALLEEKKYSKYYDHNHKRINEVTRNPSLLNEIKHMGICDIKELDDYLSNNLKNLTDLKAFQPDTDIDTDIGFIRRVLMLSDPEKYFSQKLPFNLSEHSLKLLKEKFGDDKLNEFLELKKLSRLSDSHSLRLLKEKPGDKLKKLKKRK